MNWWTSFIIVVLLGLAPSAWAASLTLTWTDASNNETGFHVERRIDPGGTYTTIAQPGANATTYSDTTGTGGQRYCYRVNAFNAAGSSDYTNEACAVFPQSIPASPSGLTVTVVP